MRTTTTTPARPTADPGTPRARRPWALPLIAAVTVMVVLAAVFAYWRPSPDAYTLTVATPSRTPQPSAFTTQQWPTAPPLTQYPAQNAHHMQLISIADALAPAASDATSGPVQFIGYEYWSREDANMVARRYQTSVRADYSAVRKEWELAKQSANFDPSLIGHVSFDAVPPSIVQIPADDVIDYGRALPSTEQAIFDRLREIDHDQQFSTADVLGMLRMINDWQIPSLATRVAILRMLAHLPGLSVEVGADRLGRRGITVAAHADGGEYSLTFDIATGQLLAYQMWMTDVAIGGPSITLPAVGEYELFTVRRHTATTPAVA